MSDRDTLAALIGVINATGVLPVTATIDKLGKVAPAASVQSLGGTRYLERWINGGGITQYPFAVHLLVADDDTAGRLDAFGVLSDLADALEVVEDYDIAGTDTPYLSERRDDGNVVWRASFMLQSTRG